MKILLMTGFLATLLLIVIMRDNARWRWLQRNGIPVERAPWLALFARVEYPPNHAGTVAWGIVLWLVLLVILMNVR